MSQIPDEVLSFSMLFGSKQHREYQEIVLCKWLNPSFGSRVGGQNNVIFSRRIYLKIELSSQRREMLFFQPAIRQFLFLARENSPAPQKIAWTQVTFVLDYHLGCVTSRANQQLQHHFEVNSCSHTRPQLLFSQLLRVVLKFSQLFPNKTNSFLLNSHQNHTEVVRTSLFSPSPTTHYPPPPPGLLSMCYCLLFVFLRVIIVTTQVEWTFLIWILQ